MRILTTIAGVIICATGAFCFAVYSNPFTDVAFVVGVVMMIAGILHGAAYLVSGRGQNRLTDTALVEGLVTFFYGFAVLNNQVTDEVLTLFFGTWLTLCGVTRISQSFYVSRFNPKDWAKIMPLALVTTMLGVIMMMPSLLSAVMPLMLVGGAFIVDGFSILIYAMFMRRKDADKGKAELEARQRAEAKKQLEKTKREQRDKLRSLSKQERDEAQAKILADQRAYELAKKEEKLAKRRARREAVAAQAGAKTIQLSKEEVEEIIAGAPADQLAEDSKAADAAAPAVAEEEALSPAVADLANTVKAAAELQDAAKVSFKAPEAIPSIKMSDPPAAKVKKAQAAEEIKLTAMNLEEIETKNQVEFDKVQLDEPKLASADEKVDRDEVLRKISEVNIPKAEAVDYTPLDLDELVAAEADKPAPKKEEKDLFTKILKLKWKDPEGK